MSDGRLSKTMRIDIPLGMRDAWMDSERRKARPEKAAPAAGENAERLGGEDFQRLLQSIYDAALITDTNGQVLDANPRAEEFLELSRAALGRVNVTSLISGADLDTLRELNDGLHDERFILIQAYCACASGRIFPAEIAVNRMLVQDRNCLCFFIRDVTVRRQDEERLRAEHHAIQNAATGIAIADLDGRITFANTAAARIWDAANHEILKGRILADLFAEAPVIGEMLETVKAGRTWEGELHARCGADGEAWVQVSAAANRDMDEELVGFVVSVMDIRDHKRAEDALRRAKEEAEELNRHLEEQTVLASRLAASAEMASIAKSEFLANMSHEIRTPMNGVIGMTGLLLDTDLNEEQRRYASTVRASGESLLTIINDILDFSKVEAGKLELEMLDFDLRAMLDEFADPMAMQAQEKGLEFICSMAPDVPSRLCGDPGRLRQVLFNLAGNAIKFTQEGEIAIRASLVSESDDRVVVRFSVRDTGIGIPADKRGILFQKFTQADASTTRKYGGTGLGLAIAKQIAELMGGTIGVESPAAPPGAGQGGAGAEFWFTACFARQAGRESGRAEITEMRGTRMLVVDDNLTNCAVLTAQLQFWGARAQAVHDGPSALQTLKSARSAGDPFRAAILDMRMPGMDGAALAAAIKREEALCDIPLLLLTTLGQRGDLQGMAGQGFAAFLTKPVRQADLLDRLSAVLSGRAPLQAAPPHVTRPTARKNHPGAARILLAEDNLVNQQVAVGLLKRLGLRADAVANGAEAVRALETIPYDLVLMDVQMPVMDGLEAARRIRDPSSAVLNHRIPVVAMTAGVMQGDREQCLDAGMNGYVSKPIAYQSLAAALEKWMPRKTGE